MSLLLCVKRVARPSFPSLKLRNAVLVKSLSKYATITHFKKPKEPEEEKPTETEPKKRNRTAQAVMDERVRKLQELMNDLQDDQKNIPNETTTSEKSSSQPQAKEPTAAARVVPEKQKIIEAAEPSDEGETVTAPQGEPAADDGPAKIPRPVPEEIDSPTKQLNFLLKVIYSIKKKEGNFSPDFKFKKEHDIYLHKFFRAVVEHHDYHVPIINPNVLVRSTDELEESDFGLFLQFLPESKNVAYVFTDGTHVDAGVQVYKDVGMAKGSKEVYCKVKRLTDISMTLSRFDKVILNIGSPDYFVFDKSNFDMLSFWCAIRETEYAFYCVRRMIEMALNGEELTDSESFQVADPIAVLLSSNVYVITEPSTETAGSKIKYADPEKFDGSKLAMIFTAPDFAIQYAVYARNIDLSNIKPVKASVLFNKLREKHRADPNSIDGAIFNIFNKPAQGQKELKTQETIVAPGFFDFVFGMQEQFSQMQQQQPAERQ